ncbi:ABC transporter ATP-binding protein [Allosediminivita pacifica]|uniref:Carbohydrate ABC transporter ATP-binding protein (CUT1 family) n=1 Tax=Allosediminivita pacifica TaxID=1267769 RepID=A0A2T6B3W7_9RHOB|nr:ABC transporter ATP-binding protein [Allosediminivita pacifica]PTX50722.1 carbohydrate ABC transporter ATP-binding protein (CUT1 family) [Allosediminivita pacifica]GGB00671.1 sugar ABC transporter ATP-binding protein [Allosediminivita pacifica]
MSGVTLKNVRKAFGAVDVIKDVSLEVPKGEFGVFVGPSGCGKSTLLRMIAGLEDTSGGVIEIGGRDVTNEEPAKRGVAMVFQSYALYPHLSVFENMAFSLRLARASKSEAKRKVHEAAEILQLTDHLDKKPSALSGGQRQRVAIGRAIVREPEVFLFDEPLSNLDAELRVQMRLELTRLHKQIGATMIYVTHDQVEAMTLADDIFVLRGGVVQQAGTPLTLYDDPDNRFVAGFIGSPAMNFLQGRVTRRTEGGMAVAVEDGELEVRVEGAAPGEGTDLVVGVRPEHLGPVESGGFTAQVEMSEELGGNSYVHSTPPSGGGDIVFERRGVRERLTGQTVRLGAVPENVFAFTPDGVRVR